MSASPSEAPQFSLVVAARPEDARVAAVESAARLSGIPGGIELVLARGRQPSVQRNLAVREARGEFIYFLDDDSVPDAGNLERACRHLADPRVAAVGGPSLCPAGAPGIEKDFAAVLASVLAFGPSRARYAALGEVRDSSEKELILCNLVMRRQPFLDAGGFDETLYPNEENALMDQLQQDGWRLVYDPAMSVLRRPRGDLRSFLKMVFRYGRGRAEQVRRKPTWRSLPNLAPAALWVLVLSVPWAGLWSLGWLVPYGVLVGADALVLALRYRRNPVRLAALIAGVHLGYGMGFWRGLVTALKGPERGVVAAVTVERVPVGPVTGPG